VTTDEKFRELLEVLYGGGRAAAKAKCAEYDYPFDVLMISLRNEGHVATRALFKETLIARRKESDLVATDQCQETDADELTWLPEETTMSDLCMYGPGLYIHWTALNSVFNDATNSTGKRTVRTLLHMSDKDLLALDPFSFEILWKLDAYLLQQLGVSRYSV
jgi:hypothetical protein